jgi:hypothetical protein
MDKIELEELSQNANASDNGSDGSDSGTETSSTGTGFDKQPNVTKPRDETRPQEARRSSSIHLERRTSEIMEQYENVDPEFEAQMDADFHPSFPHFKAILFRRWVVIKRTMSSVLANVFVTIAISILALICEALLNSIAKETTYDYTYNASSTATPRIFVQTNKDDALTVNFQNLWLEAIKFMCKEELETDCDLFITTNHSEFLEKIYEKKTQSY